MVLSLVIRRSGPCRGAAKYPARCNSGLRQG
jgi:hypothetical protein